jgi:ABC-type lipoprotein release transport system permease subunit
MNILRFIARRAYLIVFIARKHFIRNALSSIGLFLSLLVVITILGVLEPVKKMIRQKMESSLPPQTIRLVPELSVMGKGNKNWNLFRKEQDNLMPINARTLERAKKWGKPGDVRQVSATQLLQQPAIGRFEDPILSQLGFQFDLVLQGVPQPMLKPHMRCRAPYKGTRVEDKGDKMIDEIPVIVPETYLEIMYAYAMINGLPNISANNLIGMKLRAQLGQSIVGTKWPKTEDALLVVCGFAPAGVVSALGVPLEWVQKKHRERKQMNALISYDQIFVEVANEKALPAVLKAAKAERLRIPEQSKKFDSILKSLEKLDLIFLIVAAILGGLAAIALANSFALLAVQNRYEFGLYLVFGSSMFFLWFLLAVEGALWGFIHSSLALLLSEPALKFLQNHLNELPWLMKLSGTDLSELKLELSSSERFLIYGATIGISALASLIPGAVILGKRTLSLVKKD